MNCKMKGRYIKWQKNVDTDNHENQMTRCSYNNTSRHDCENIAITGLESASQDRSS